MGAYRDLAVPLDPAHAQRDALRQGIEKPAIFNHSRRSYLYGRFLGEQQGLGRAATTTTNSCYSAEVLGCQLETCHEPKRRRCRPAWCTGSPWLRRPQCR